MKAIAAGAVLSAILTLAGPLFATIYVNDFACTKQTFVGRGTYSSNSNYSTLIFGRVCKGQFDATIMDFDRTGMATWVQSVYTACNGPTLSNVSQIGNGAVTMTMYMTPYDGWEDSATPPPTIFGHMFWPGVRLSQGQNWVESTATFNNADTGKPWLDASGAALTNIWVNTYDMTANMILNATSATWGQADTIGGGSDVYVYDTPRPWVLDQTVAWAAMKNPDVVGFMCVLDQYNKPWGDSGDDYSDDNPGRIYSRRHGLTQFRPCVELDVDSTKIPSAASHTYLPADFNNDLKVSFADYLILEANFGKSGKTNAQGDANNDGKVSFADYLILEAEFGHTTTPEPATIGLLIAGGIAILRRRK